MKTCNKCHIVKPTAEFYKKATAKDGLFWWCKDCHKAYLRANYAAAYSDPTFAKKENLRICRYYREHPSKRIPLTGAKAAAHVAKYRSSKDQRTPKWLTTDDLWMLSEAYELAALRTKLFGFPWHVDHVIPLRGKLASGLHVPHNLQVIPGTDNVRKSNRFPVS